MIVLAVTIRCKPDKIKETEALLSNFPGKANLEPGCIQYELFRGAKDRQIFFIFEKWQDQPSLDEHRKQPYLIEFKSRVSELLVAPYEALVLGA